MVRKVLILFNLNIEEGNCLQFNIRYVMYTLDSSGIHISKSTVTHRNNEYEESGFNTLLDMQSKHFWYRGRHRFILNELLRIETKSKLMSGTDIYVNIYVVYYALIFYFSI